MSLQYYVDLTAGNDMLAIEIPGSTKNGTDAVSILPLHVSNHVNFFVVKGEAGLDDDGGGANIGGKGVSGVVMASYDTGVSESNLLSCLQSIDKTNTSGSLIILTQSNLDFLPERT